jgi:hypothetical protein
VYLKQREIYFVTDGKDTLPEKYKNINFLNDSNENYYDSHEDVYEYIMEKIKIPGGLRI